MDSEQIVIVDSEDCVTGATTRAAMRVAGLIYRVNYILVFSSGGELLVQRRTASKDMYPGYLDLAAGGVVLAGESYELSAERELQEELGVSATLKKHFEFWFEDLDCEPANRNWGRVFSCVHDGPFSLQPEEVESAEFMRVEQALALNPSTVTPDTRQVLLAYLFS
jgi:8-oxo-dGTP pyrophosphatase MutT (NUDIX family)